MSKTVSTILAMLITGAGVAAVILYKKTTNKRKGEVKT